MKPLLRLFLLLLALPASAAEQLSVRVLDGGGLGASEAQLVLGASVELARELSGLVIHPVPAVSRRCADDACLRALLSEAQAEHGLFLLVTPAARRGTLEVEATWMDGAEGSASRRRISGAATAELKSALRPALTALLPPFVRKGWGGLVVASDSARIRVDGRALAASSAVVPLTAGPHEVDLLLPSGEAALSRELVPEGARLRLTPPAEVSAGALGAASRGKGLRTASYVTFSLGALALAGSLVAGGLSRSALHRIEPCVGVDRTCTRYPDAKAAYDKSDRYARTGNVLLGAGGALSTVGIGLFVFDLASSER
ncbi:MAG: hypothetical protein ACJ8AT_27825 [Hyalangium sp.]|uniref:hypothetical protein n=1 Tax=Hyalangium sp. TaxID=2028555 RepID=UPI00389B320B